MINLLLLIAGFFPLIIGANLLVDSASALAKRFNVPNMVIGLTIVAFGTSAPELTVNVFAAINGSNDIVLGNILGSNIFNILAIAGLAAIIYPLTVKSKTTWIEIPLAFLAALVVLVITGDQYLDKSHIIKITRSDGMILLLFFTVFIGYNVQLMLSSGYEETTPIKEYKLPITIILLALGFVLLVTGGKIIVNFAVKFAQALGISERIIALTIVSVGTSLPELATSAIAAYKKNIDIAIGNIVGSNIFNTFFVLGISAVIRPITVSTSSMLDIAVNILASFLLFVFIFIGKGRKIARWEGVIFVLIYISYVITLIVS